MLGTLIKKEITETILDMRFWVVTVLFLILIPLGMYVSTKEYEQRLSDYQRSYQMYRQNNTRRLGPFDWDVVMEGYRPPAPGSVVAVGLEPFLPDKVLTSHSGFFRMVKESQIDDPQSLLFGRVDFLFIVSFVASLAALILTFSSISGEKETGTLRLTLANPLPRAHLLLGKIIGKYATLVTPFVASLLIGLVVLCASPNLSALSPVFLGRLGAVVAVTLIFLLAMTSLGVFVSTLSGSSMASVILALLFWVFFVLAVPKISPMIARAVYPVESKNVVEIRKRAVAEQFNHELEQRRRQIFDRGDSEVRLAGGLDLDSSDPKHQQALAWYDRQLATLKQEYTEKVTTETKKIEQDHRNKKNIQTRIAVSLSRISPVSCYMYLISELSGTGVAEVENLRENAQRYQDTVKQAIYERFETRKYGGTKQQFPTIEMSIPPSLSQLETVPPTMDYKWSTLSDAFDATWPDLVLMFAFNFLFFAGAFMRLNRYDVR